MLSGLSKTIIMKTLNNNKGSLLVILIIVMTLMAVLGAGFVSMVSSKHEGFAFLVNGQKANMVAKAGVEWAIRYASDGLGDDLNSIFFSNPTLTFSKPLIPSDITEGSFSTSYDYTTNVLTVDGKYHGITQRTTLSHFLQYLSPLTLIPDANKKPSYRSGYRQYLDVPVSGNYDTTVTQIDLTTGLSGRHLRYIDGPGGRIFCYNDPSHPSEPNPSNNYPDCNSGNTNTPCNDWLFDWHGVKIGFLGVLLSSYTQFASPNLQQGTINSNTPYTYVFTFYEQAPSSSVPRHTITFHSTPVASTIIFQPN